MIDAIEKAIFAKDPAAVVLALAGMSESKREAAREPLAIFMLAIGFDRGFVQLLEASVTPESPDVLAKRKAEAIEPMSRKDRTYDYKMSYIAWLAAYGLFSHRSCLQAACVPDYEAESAQILADRQPPWFEEWLTSVTNVDEESSHRNIAASFWCRLYGHNLINSVNDAWVSATFLHQLAESYAAAPEATRHVLKNVPSAVAAIYELPQQEYQLTQAKEWVPVVQFLGSEGLLEHAQFLTACVEAVYRLSNQTERNGSVILAKAASQKAAKCAAETLADLQSNWVSLLSDHQTAIAGFGLEQLVAVEKAGQLNVVAAVAELPQIFQHKAKNHALKAIKLLDRIAKKAGGRSQALQAAAMALSHGNKDVQQAGLDCLAKHLHPDDADAIEAVQSQEGMIAATLRPQLSKLVDSVGGSGEAIHEVPSEQTTSADLDAVIARGKLLSSQSRETFQIDAAIAAADRRELACPGQWKMSDIRVLASQPKLKPIESLEELFDVTAAAVERCESADTPEQIVDGVVRFGLERPECFDARKGPLAKRACCDGMERPNRGIVGGVLGDAFSSLICAWLSVDEEDDDWVCNYYPMSPFLREVASLLKQKITYQLLSTPTHAGGWIDPTDWVQRLHTIESQKVDFLESDLIRSLLRLAPDRRNEALRLLSAGDVALSARFQKLTTLVLDLEMPNDKIALDESWSPYVWMAAIRSRDAWIDLQHYLPEDEQAQVAPELWTLPDVLKPSDYQWHVLESHSNSGFGWNGLVESRPMPGDDESSRQPDEPSLKDMLSALSDDGDLDQMLDRIDETPAQQPGAFLAAQLNYLQCYPAPQYVYPYIATQWPMKLDWYWNLATIGLSRRVESGPSVDERYDQFLLPIFEPDRPLCRMAARALWIATASKDGNARGMATEVWIALITEDRCPVDIVVAALQNVFAGGWLKINRIAAVFTDVSVVSPLHAFVLALLLESFLSECDDFPPNTAKLLEVLDECNERLGSAVSEHLSAKLSTIKSGKAKGLARSLMGRADNATSDRNCALQLSLEARIQRAENTATQ